MAHATMRELREAQTKVAALEAKLAALKDVLQEVREALEDRYDGAPDSRTLWMGSHLNAIENALISAPAAHPGGQEV